MGSVRQGDQRRSLGGGDISAEVCETKRGDQSRVGGRVSQTEKSTRRDPEVKTSLVCSSPRRWPVWPEPHGGGAECMDVKLMRRGGGGGGLWRP